MKTFITIFGLFLSSFGFSQEVQPTAEEIAVDTYKVKFYHDNGSVMHEGNYVNGKTEGLWKSFDENGILIAEGTYVEGKKTGLWNFYNKALVNNVSYNKNTIAEVKKFYTNNLAVRD